MRIAFVYDIRENVLGVRESPALRERTTELFTAAEANAIVLALKELGHEVVVLDGLRGFAEAVGSGTTIDLVFNEAKGLYGPERKLYLPALCDVHGIRYVGSTGYAVSLARHKWHCRAVASQAGVAVAPAMFIRSLDDIDACWSTYPALVKPNFESASIGITERSLVRSREELQTQVAEALGRFPDGILVEAFVPGREVQVALIGTHSPHALPLVEVTLAGTPRMGSRFITKVAWSDDSVVFQPLEDDAVQDQLVAAAVRVHDACGLRHYSRVDFRVTDDDAPVFIEAATHPHITPGSSVVAAAAWAGLTLSGLLDRLLAEAMTGA